ncbi:PIN domain-containing protein [Mesorhizobium sp. VK4C]|uniref:PIN domain-containing protein n=1 Tax=Mesorhizobium captivum TaxID=3072319 RepID=UPI002A2488A9|nr:PIN domain-containing protein [Mesorhizobium sp. VK4C]MDX8497559.1 PIN domain-containing protein [Mesorhizobium sp. VK4C]
MIQRPYRLLEYEAVLTRAEQTAVHGLSAMELDRLLAGFAALAEPVEPHFLWRPQLADPKDGMVLEAAVNGRADALVTHNRRDFAVAARAFHRFTETASRPISLF